MIERCCNRVDVLWSHDNSLHAIAHDVARFARSDLRQRAGGRFISDFGAALPLLRKNMGRALVEIVLRIAHKSHDADVIAPELLEKRLRLVVDGTDQP